MDLFWEVESGSTLTTTELLDRVRQNYEIYAERNRKKQQKEIDHGDN